jgi:hypothetical protein
MSNTSNSNEYITIGDSNHFVQRLEESKYKVLINMGIYDKYGKVVGCAFPNDILYTEGDIIKDPRDRITFKLTSECQTQIKKNAWENIQAPLPTSEDIALLVVDIDVNKNSSSITTQTPVNDIMDYLIKINNNEINLDFVSADIVTKKIKFMTNIFKLNNNSRIIIQE